MSERGYELVRVSTELLEELIREDSPPVVVVGINRYDDNTCELVVRRIYDAETADELSRKGAA
jgi:CO dehydrogenase/acetyl-CoA synthase epsilon subunit